jgi:hypothetical protein
MPQQCPQGDYIRCWPISQIRSGKSRLSNGSYSWRDNVAKACKGISPHCPLSPDLAIRRWSAGFDGKEDVWRHCLFGAGQHGLWLKPRGYGGAGWVQRGVEYALTLPPK